MDERAFTIKVALMRKAQKAYVNRSMKNDWKSNDEKQQSIRHCKGLEAEVDDMLKETFAKAQTLFNENNG